MLNVTKLITNIMVINLVLIDRFFMKCIDSKNYRLLIILASDNSL